ncbi:MAG TPA: argininosuccinate lyase, partial [Chthonomonadales bacterium]|nr:argininosuccinate lyase [Chthonomonadales bacterium]
MRKLWGGRFEQEPDLAVERLNNSLPFDQALWRQDIRASIAHAAMLGECAIVTAEEAAQLTQGLAAIQQGLENGDLTLPPDAEDIHTAVEALLADRLGAVAGKLHTARSRNDQVCADLRLYLRDECDVIREELILLERAILDLAKRETETIMPGYTHLQHAQPITLAHHAMAYFWMLDRDRERLSDARRRINRSPLGAGALAGTGFAIDRRQTAAALGFESVLENSIDAVSDRDFAVEFLSFASTLMMHLSRFAEDIVLWN